MSTISCAHDLCAADRHEATPTPIRHHRMTSGEGEPYSVVARWIDGDQAAARVEMTHEGTTVSLTPSDAAFWARILTLGGSWSPAVGASAAGIAIDLGVAAEVLSLLDENGKTPEFGSRHLAMSVDRAVAHILGDEDDDEQLYVAPHSATGHGDMTRIVGGSISPRSDR